MDAAERAVKRAREMTKIKRKMINEGENFE